MLTQLARERAQFRLCPRIGGADDGAGAQQEREHGEHGWLCAARLIHR
jgi:hypothetical protein